MGFKVGDRVKLVRIDKGELRSICSYEYKKNLNKIFTIKKIKDSGDRKYAILEETSDICPYLDDLELVKKTFTKSDLKDNDIVTYKNGDKRTVKGTTLFQNQNRVNTLENYRNNLTEKNGLKDLDIVKVERPTGYETVFERKEEILDEAEKRYLKQVIRPFKNTARFIEKEENETISRIKICFDYHFMFFPPLEDKTMYKGMKPNRAYTVKELGL